MEQKWRKKTRYDLKRQFFPDPVEYLDVQSSIEKLISRVRTAIRNGTFTIEQPRRFQIEKSLGLCRLMVQPSAEEAVILQCLSDKIYSDIKKQSPSKNAFFEPQDHSFKPTEDQEYGTFKSWKKFQGEILRFQTENKYIVVTDIANYYDFIDLMQLRNVITSFVKVQEPLFDFLLHIVSSLVWKPDFMPPRQIGLPQIDLDAPRLLAHCYLFELDRFMEERAQKNYARFMDDIDAGVDTIENAKRLLRDTDLVLQSRSLRLNAGKTRILSAKEAFAHFRVRENGFLDRLDVRLDALAEEGGAVDQVFLKGSRLLKILYRDGYFKNGNGEKILKRIVGLYNKFKIRIPSEIYSQFIRLHPNLRESTLRNSSICGFGKEEFEAILSVFDSGLVCDDFFRMTLAKRLVDGLILYGGQEEHFLNKLLQKYGTDDFCAVYGEIWILSRFGKPKTIFAAVSKREKFWSTDKSLSRLVAGMWPRVSEDKSLSNKFYMYLSRHLLPAGSEILEFHRDLEGDATNYARIKAILHAQNGSMPLRCSHEKLLVMKSVLKSDKINISDKNKLLKTHSVILSDKSYISGGIL